MIHKLSSHKREREHFILFRSKQSLLIGKCFSTCMAANLHSRKLATVGKQFVSQISSRSSASLLLSRSVHVSVYEKNSEDHVYPAVVPNELIQVQSEKYWAPHPQTGVFGPATDHQAIAGGDLGFHSLPASVESVLEQKAFFRPLENLDKPAHS